jgi:hypothetical protein
MEYCGASFENEIITAFEPMYIEILNNDMVGLASTTDIDMLEHLFVSLQLIWSTTLKTCTRHGIIIGTWKPYSKKFKIV